MTACKRCHRKLKGSASIRREYGPICWKKVEDENQAKIYEPCTIEYSGLASRVMQKIGERVQHGKVQNCSCGEPLENGELHSYDHDSGYNLRGFGKPQRVYLQCGKCGHQLSARRLRIDLSDLEKLKAVTV